MIISFSHNDLDALGCELCIKEKYQKEDINYFNTNYKNIEEQVQKIINLCKICTPDLIFITDICFNNNKKELLELSKIANIIFIDHHEYDQGFFNDLPKNIHIIYDKNKSAAKLTAETLKSPEYMQKLTDIIQSFDIWLKDSKYFDLGFNMNMYFWYILANHRYNIQDIHKFFYPKLDHKFKETISYLQKEANDYLESNKSLIKTFNGVTFAFIDKYFMNLTEQLFKDHNNKIVFIVTTYGKIMVRISTDLEEHKCHNIKNVLIDETTGHLRAFSFEKFFNNIQEAQEFCQQTYLKIKDLL